MEEIFEQIYLKNLWQDAESRSGPGSSVFRTRLVRPALTELFRELGVRSILDLPCGDFNWMRFTDLTGISYTGADIVRKIIDRNTALYSSDSRRFVCLDMTRDQLPSADLILCRDGLVHLSFSSAILALRQMRLSGAKYLLATTHSEHPRNEDIATGAWRKLNLEKPPFCFPPHIRAVWDGPKPDGTSPDKLLALYELADLRLPEGLAGGDEADGDFGNEAF